LVCKDHASLLLRASNALRKLGNRALDALPERASARLISVPGRVEISLGPPGYHLHAELNGVAPYFSLDRTRRLCESETDLNLIRRAGKAGKPFGEIRIIEADAFGEWHLELARAPARLVDGCELERLVGVRAGRRAQQRLPFSGQPHERILRAILRVLLGRAAATTRRNELTRQGAPALILVLLSKRHQHLLRDLLPISDTSLRVRIEDSLTKDLAAD
jgi:hypothetical protein